MSSDSNVSDFLLSFALKIVLIIHLSNTATTSVTKLWGTKNAYDRYQCQTDTFSVTAPGNHAPPVICGTNTGEHSEYFLVHDRIFGFGFWFRPNPKCKLCLI